MMINPNDEIPTLPKISPPPREPRAWDDPVHSNFIPLHQTPVYNIAQVESIILPTMMISPLSFRCPRNLGCITFCDLYSGTTNWGTCLTTNDLNMPYAYLPNII